MTIRENKTVKWGKEEFIPIQLLIDELRKERTGRIYENRVIIEAVMFYRKYRKLVGES